MSKVKITSYLSAIMLVLMLVLAGCGNNSAANTTASNSAGSNSSDAAQSADNSAGNNGNSSGGSTGTTELLISAAASLTESLNEIKPLYEAAHPNVKLTYNFGASGTLQQQIEQGAPADLFFSAGASQMKALLDEGLISPDLNENLLDNELVLVVPKDSDKVTKIEDLSGPDIKNIAIGTPESVPAGKYAQQTLTYYKLWDSLQPKLVQAKDVKQVLNYVETGNAEAGFVYKTDASSSTGVTIALSTDAASHDAIEYPAGVLKDSKHQDEAKAFYEYLQSDEATQIFSKYGFTAAK